MQIGYEAAGTVKMTGSDVSGLAEGDAVSVIPKLDMSRWST